MSENAHRFHRPPRELRPAKEKRTKPKLEPRHIRRAHEILHRRLDNGKPIPGHNKKNAAWLVKLTSDDKRFLGPRWRQVKALLHALEELENAGIIDHDGFSYQPRAKRIA